MGHVRKLVGSTVGGYWREMDKDRDTEAQVPTETDTAEQSRSGPGQTGPLAWKFRRHPLMHFEPSPSA